MKDELAEKGFCHIPNKSDVELTEILSQLGHVINETDVIANSESKSLVTSDKYLDFHTDNHLAKYILWHCKKQAEKGGQSMLCDAEKVYAELTEEEKLALSKIHVYEHKMFPENRNSNPIVREVDGQHKFYYSFWLAREKYRELPVFEKWRDLIQTASHVKIRLEENDILVIDNHRIFHGRTEIIGERNLKRYWLNPDFEPTKTLYSRT
ncbi:TauD/TfdA family dioxygenase [Gaetbulibacter saemankumensis]|uniref:TauD/TfdA family dioxygenase n=1 Tax=Gaetbulibacter saemankumensis TaxID=311208 RepID=UPI00146EF6F7|nr:TauD/TfdA family dioxygenase [Gaetbulibacter saemankumensis]